MESWFFGIKFLFFGGPKVLGKKFGGEGLGKKFGGPKVLGFRQTTLLCLGYRLSKHKMTNVPRGPSGYAYGRVNETKGNASAQGRPRESGLDSGVVVDGYRYIFKHSTGVSWTFIDTVSSPQQEIKRIEINEFRSYRDVHISWRFLFLLKLFLFH